MLSELVPDPWDAPHCVDGTAELGPLKGLGMCVTGGITLLALSQARPRKVYRILLVLQPIPCPCLFKKERVELRKTSYLG